MKVRPEDYQSPALLYGVYNTLGRKDEAAKLTRRTIELTEAQLEANPDDTRALYLGAVAVDPTDTGTLYNVACLYSLAGMKNEAMDYLENAVANGFAQKAWIEQDGDLTALRDMPRYKALLQRLK